VFPQLERHLVKFLQAQQARPDNSEYLIPSVLGQLVQEKSARVRVLPTSARWFGVTHANDKPGVIANFRAMVDAGEYPSPLWQNG